MMRPAIPIASPLIAPSVSPSSIALVVPRAWDAVPIATPTATLSFMRKKRHINGPRTAPIIPVITIAATVIAGKPPICFEISIPIGVVTDLGTRDLLMTSSSPKRLDRIKMLENSRYTTCNYACKDRKGIILQQADLFIKRYCKNDCCRPEKERDIISSEIVSLKIYREIKEEKHHKYRSYKQGIKDRKPGFLIYSTSPTGSENHLSPLRFQTFNRKVF